MPELPEVETYRRFLEATSLNQTIIGLDVEDHKLLTTDYDTLAQQLVGNFFTGTHRHGKNLFVRTNSEAILLMHFGMTGSLAYFRNDEDRPRFARIVFYFSSGFRLGFLCPRKFERIGLVDSIEAYSGAKKLGPDALEASEEDLSKRLKSRKVPIKPVLMDQATVAGLGNWIVDEVLFQAGIHPEIRADLLTHEQVKRLHASIRLVLQTAIEQEANYGDFPASFLIHARAWDQSPYSDPKRHLSCPQCNTVLQIGQVGGRTTYFCISCQPTHLK